MARFERVHEELHDPAWLQAQVDAMHSARDISKMLGCHVSSVIEVLQRYQIQVLRRCRVCNTVFRRDDYREHIKTCKRIPMFANCRHCHERMLVSNVDKHEAYCLDNPAVRELTRQLMDDGNGVIISRNAYMERRAKTTAATYDVLRRRYGTWLQIAAAFGLMGGAEALDVFECAQVALGYELTAWERAILADEMNHGFDVCRVRELPSGGVAYMLR